MRNGSCWNGRRITKTPMDKRQVAAYAVIIAFMIVTVGHVASYTGSFEAGGWRFLGWFYAFGVDASIIVCAWLTRWKTTERWAWVGYVSFVVASGALNVAQVAPASLGAWVYATFPTAAQALLGFLARDAGGFRSPSRDTDEEKRKLRAEVKRLGVELAQKRKLTAPNFEQFAQVYAGLDGQRAGLKPSGANVALAQAGFAPISEGTARGWLRKVRENG